MRRGFAVTGLILLTFNLVPSFSQDTDSGELPPSWDVKKIEKDATNSVVPGRFHVLAWHASAWTYMGKKWGRETCLALRVIQEGESRHGSLYHLYREPHAEDPRWRLSFHHALGGEAGPTGTWYIHEVEFTTRPGNKEIYDSLGYSSNGVGWRFERGEHCIGCGVCEKSWQEAIGERPTRFFPTKGKDPGK